MISKLLIRFTVLYFLIDTYIKNQKNISNNIIIIAKKIEDQ